MTMAENVNVEAFHVKNTAEKLPINPLTFDEAALSKILSERFGQDNQSSTKPETASAEAQVEEEPSASLNDEDRAESPEATDQSQDEVQEPQVTEDEDESSGVQKRINKLVAQRKEAAAKAEALERELNDARAKLEQLEAQPPVARSSNEDVMFSDVWDEGKLQQEWSKARELRRWCEDNADGCEVNGKEFSAQDIKAIRRKVEDALDVHIPKRMQFLTNYKQVKPVAESLYPFWKDRANPDYTAAQQILRQFPSLSEFPDYQIAIGDFLEGRKARMAKEAAAKSPKAKLPIKTAPKQPGAPSAAPVRADKSKSEVDSARSKFMRTGNVAELTNLLQKAGL